MESDRAAPVALWAVPRSVSTALEKALSQHWAVQAIHEPFTDCYYFSERRRSDRYGTQPHKLNYGLSDVKAQLSAVTAPVTVVKDLCFQAEPYVSPELLASWRHVFVVRHPARVWLSLTKLKPDFTEEEFGFTSLATMWRRVVAKAGHPGRVVEGDRFRLDPETVLRDLCDWIGVDFQPSMLKWNDGRIRDWSPDERESQRKWHGVLERSHGVLPPKPEIPEEWEPAGPEHGRIYRRAVAIYEDILSQGRVS